MTSLIEQAIEKHGKEQVENWLKQGDNSKLLKNWDFIGRKEQKPPPGNWQTWVYLAGRGSGKTRSQAEFCKAGILQGCKRIAAVSPTAADSRKVITEGEGGILETCEDMSPKYESSLLTIRFPKYDNAKIFLYSAEEPDRLRGPQHDRAIGDEFAAWKKLEYTFDMLQFGLRLGKNPQSLFGSTPRPLKFLKKLISDPNTVITKGTTYDNKANLAPQFFDRILTKYEGSRLGRQEIDGEILEDNENALFNRDNIDDARIDEKNMPQFDKIVIALDPSGTSNEKSDECGIVAVGTKMINGISHFYILADKTCRKAPEEWAKIAVELYHRLQANYIVAETNFGGDMVKAVLRHKDPNIMYKAVRASRGKAVRAEPVVILYEQGRVHHVGSFPKLEDEMCQWDVSESDYSPNRLDALVWGVTSLSKKKGKFMAR